MPNLRYVPVVSDALPEDGWTGRTGFVHRAVLEDFPDLSRATRCMPAARRSWSIRRARLHEQAGLPPDEFFADSFTTEADKHSPGNRMNPPACAARWSFCRRRLALAAPRWRWRRPSPSA
jgi:hypothetical protein